MGIRDFLSDLNEDRKRAQRKLKDEFLGFTSSASRKLIPRELRPALPFLSAAVPFMVPASGIFAGPLGRALLSSGSNLLAQGLSDPEAEDLNLLSAAIAGATGALSSPEVSGSMRSGIETGGAGTTAREAGIMAQSGVQPPPVGFMQGAENIGREGIASLSDVVTGTGETFRKFGRDPGALFTKAGAKELGKAIAIPAAQGTGDFAYTEANKALRAFNAFEAEEMARAGADMEAIADARRAAIREAMQVSDFTEDEIMETLGELGLKDGGRVGYAKGKLVKEGLGALKLFRRPKFASSDEAKMTLDLVKTGRYTEDQLLELDGDQIAEIYQFEGFTVPEPIEGSSKIIDIEEIMENIKNVTPEDMATGGIARLKDGGMLDFGGKEMDLRGGGFVPIGKKEKADDVPARLSKNEFVMTADAVRAAGGGSVNKGAQRMYNLMNDLEARA